MRKMTYGGNTYEATYDGGSDRVTSKLGGVTTTYSYGAGLLQSTTSAGGNTVYTPGVSQRKDGVDSYFHQDWIGSTRYLTDSTGNTAPTAYRFDGYGVQSAGSTPGATISRFAGGHGYEDDGPNGLMMLGARYYSPGLGRFISPDPIGHAGGLNLYGYCGNDPVNKVDPSGLMDEPRGWAKGVIEGSGYAGLVLGGFFGGGGGGLLGLTTGPAAVVASPAAGVQGGILGAAGGWVGGQAVGHGAVWVINGIGWLGGKAGQTIAAMSSKKSGGTGVGNAGSGRGGAGCGRMNDKQYEEAVRKATGGKREILRDLTGKDREFDSVTKEAIHQASTTADTRTWMKHNAQWKQTIRLAAYMGKKAHFWFSKGAHNADKATIRKAGGIVHEGLD